MLQIRPINSQVCCHKYIRSPYGYLSFVTNQTNQLTGVLPQVHQITPWVSVLLQIRQTNLQVCSYRYIKSTHGYLCFVTNWTSQLAGVLPHLNPINSWVCRFVTDQTKLPIDVLGLLHLILINSQVYCYI